MIPPRQVALVWHSERRTTEAQAGFVALAAAVGSRLEHRAVA
jgi:hypothetical protein